MKMRKIGVLTSGGDAPGMNAAIAAVVKTAKFHNMEVVGINYGYKGLLDGDMAPINTGEISDCINRGGTILGSARCLEFKLPEKIKQAVEVAKNVSVDGLVVIGGDGSFRGARDLSLAGLPTIGIPGTIDNDIACSEYTIGYDTALNTVIDCIDKINDTTRSHNRCAFVEVMGNKAGYLAIEVAIACGADSVLIAEQHLDIEKSVVDCIAKKYKEKKHFLVVVSESISKTSNISSYDIMNRCVEKAKEKYGIELDARLTVLGHVQRGGKPTHKDRVAAMTMGKHAVDLLVSGTGNRVVGIQGGKVVDFDILEGLNMKKNITAEVVDLSTIISL